MNKDVKYINDGKPLAFDSVSGFAINPDGTTALFSGDFRNILLAVDGTGTVIVYGSNQETPPNFTASVTINNFFVPIVTADYSVQNTYYDGTAGVVVSSSAKLVELNTNLITWFAVHRSVNTVNVKATLTNNQ